MSLLTNPWVICGALAALVVSFGGGVTIGVRYESNATKAQLLEQERELREAYVAQVESYRAMAQDVSKELANATAASQEAAVAFRTELARVRSERRPLAVCPPPAVPAQATALAAVEADEQGSGEPRARLPPEPRLTADFGRLYDAGTTLGMPSTGDPEPVDGAASGAGLIAPEDVLAVNAENGEICNGLRAQVLAWQSLARRHGWVR